MTPSAMRCRRLCRDGKVMTRVWEARTWWQRARGLLGRPPLREGQGLLLRPCASVHGWGMRYPLDVVFLDRKGLIRKLARLRPWGFAACLRAHQTVELPAGDILRLRLAVGQQLELRGADGESSSP